MEHSVVFPIPRPLYWHCQARGCGVGGPFGEGLEEHVMGVRHKALVRVADTKDGWVMIWRDAQTDGEAGLYVLEL